MDALTLSPAFIVSIVVVLYLLSAIQILAEYERGVIFRLRASLDAVGLVGSEVVRSTLGCYRLHLPAAAKVDVEEAGRLLHAARAALESGDAMTARQMAAESAARQAQEHGMKKVDVFVKGPGSGRETAIRSLQAAGLEVGSINDVTPQAHNGCRPPKRRRV